MLIEADVKIVAEIGMQGEINNWTIVAVAADGKGESELPLDRYIAVHLRARQSLAP